MAMEIVDFPIKKGDFPVRYVKLPEGKLVHITPISRTGLWYANNELVTGANLNQLTSLGGLTL